MNLNATLIGQSITFLVFVMFCMKYIWPPIKQAMLERQEAIASGLRASEEADEKLAQAANNAEQEITAAKAEAASIIEQARARASQMVEDAKTDARSEGERLVEAARAEIEQEVNRAKEGLRTQVAALVIDGAEQVLKDSIDPSKHDQMLQQLAAEL